MKRLLPILLTWLLLAASAQAQTNYRSLNYLYSIAGSKTLAGQHNDQKDGTNASTYTERVNNITGKYPALYSGDFLFHGDAQLRWDVTYEAERQWKAGAVVNLMWHACPPNQNAVCNWDGGLLSHLSDAEWSDLITDGGRLNGVWKARMDDIAVYLQYLEDKGVEVMWRPLHEMNQNAFWWGGRTGSNGTRRLYQITHDYLTKTKGLSNLIWVWDVQDLSTNYADYNPGSSYFDVAALDVYGDGFSNTAYYNALLQQAGNKPMVIGETFKVPPASLFQAQPRWAFFMIWSYGLQQNNSDQEIRDSYANARIITRDEMPGWDAPTTPNLAAGKAVTVSSTEVGENIAARVTDGDMNTRWSSLYSDAQWLYVDLGATYKLDRVRIFWEVALGKDFQLQVSNDAVNWTTIKTVTGNTSLKNDFSALNGTGRYLRMLGTARGTEYGYSIYELQAFGTAINSAPSVSLTSPSNNANYAAPASISMTATASDKDGTITKVEFYNGSTLLATKTSAPYSFTWSNVAVGTYSISAKAYDNAGASSTSAKASVSVAATSTNLAKGKAVVASSVEDATMPASNAVDGNTATRWSSLYADAQWIYVDLGASYNVNRVRIAWEAAYGKDFQVQVSNNASAWSTIKTVAGNTQLTNDLTGLAGTGRYVRMLATARGTAWGYSIFELEVYGTASTGNAAPSVSLSAPANNASYTAPAAITINANASDSDGSIAKVEFYNGSTLLGSDSSAPYSFNWANVAAGTYDITAKAIDDKGAATTSAKVSVVVKAPSSGKLVVAYVANWIDLNAFANTIDYSKVTHLNLAFENPNANGDLSFNAGDAALIQKAHANNVKVYLSIGGGSISEDANARAQYFNLISDANRANFVAKILAYLKTHQFDGLDVDLEGPAINADYGKFIAALSSALKPANKGLTAALSQGYGGADVPSSTFAQFDWVNIMAYDATGPWAPNSPGQHSSYAFAQSNLQYWLGRGLPKTKAVLGLPFYGYGFGAQAGEWPYSKIIASYAGAENLDQVGSTIWYNGMPTIKSKVNYAVDQAIAGVMIWELSQDVAGAKSLLGTIDATLKARGVK